MHVIYSTHHDTLVDKVKLNIKSYWINFSYESNWFAQLPNCNIESISIRLIFILWI